MVEISQQPIPTGRYYIFEYGSGSVLECPENKKDKGTVVVQNQFNGKQHQAFYFHLTKDGYNMIESLYNGLYWAQNMVDITNNTELILSVIDLSVLLPDIYGESYKASIVTYLCDIKESVEVYD